MTALQDIDAEIQNIKDGTCSSFAISYQSLTDEQIQNLAEAIKGSSSLRELGLTYARITPDQAKILAPALKNNRSIAYMWLTGNPLQDEGAFAFADALRNNDTLTEISLESIHCTQKGAFALIDAAASIDTLTYFCIHQAPNIPLSPHLEQAFIQRAHQNLHQIDESVEELEELTHANFETAKELKELLAQPLDTLTSAEWMQIYTRRSVIFRITYDNEPEILDALDATLALLKTFPLPAPETITTPESLITPEPGFPAPLDNPHIWSDFPALCRALNEKGAPLTLEHLQCENRDGQSFLAAALQYAPAESFFAGLQESNISLHTSILLEKPGKPSPIFSSIINRGLPSLTSLFRSENWVGVGARELQSILRAVPQELRNQIPNLHQLVARPTAIPMPGNFLQ